jgi:DNA-binding MarR family transcriptional regulator
MPRAARLDRVQVLLPSVFMEHAAAIRKTTACKLIKMPQLMLLIMANKHMAGWSVTDLVAATRARPSAITMAKNKLIGDELMVEHTTQRDRRRTKVYLTQAGRNEAGAMWNALRALAAAENTIRACGS